MKDGTTRQGVGGQMEPGGGILVINISIAATSALFWDTKLHTSTGICIKNCFLISLLYGLTNLQSFDIITINSVADWNI